MNVKRTLSGVLTVLIIICLSLVCATTVFGANLKVYSEDSSCGRVVNGGSLTVEDDASLIAVGNTLTVSGTDKKIYASPDEGYVFDGWKNVPADGRVKDGSVILAGFKPIGVDDSCKVKAVIAEGCKDMGNVGPKTSVTLIADSKIEAHGSSLIVGSESFTATAKGDAVFASWQGIPKDGIVSEDITVTAVFEIPENAVVVSLGDETEGGSLVSSAGYEDISVPAGAGVTVKGDEIVLAGREYVRAVPHTGYEFIEWNGIPRNGKITEDIEISAAFRKKEVTDKTDTSEYSDAGVESFKTDLIFGAMDNPVDDGLWVIDNDGTWYYEWKVPMANAWGCLVNPYANQTQPQYGWFFFDRTGQMLTGWRIINGKWYYLETVSNGCKGQLYVDTGTPQPSTKN